MKENDEILKPEDAAEYLKLSRKNLMLRYKQGKIRGARLGYRTIRFYKSDLDLYMMENLEDKNDL